MATISHCGWFRGFNVSIVLFVSRVKEMLELQVKERNISAKVPNMLDDKLEYLAARQLRSKSFIIRAALEQYLLKFEAQQEKI